MDESNSIDVDKTIEMMQGTNTGLLSIIMSDIDLFSASNPRNKTNSNIAVLSPLVLQVRMFVYLMIIPSTQEMGV